MLSNILVTILQFLLFISGIFVNEFFYFVFKGGIKTEIEGPPVLRLPPGGTLSLQCTISRLNLPPKNLHWKHEKQILTSQTRPGVSLEFEKLSGESHTKLVIVDLKSSDEGTYQCTTDVSRPATVQVFIGKKHISYLEGLNCHI